MKTLKTLKIFNNNIYKIIYISLFLFASFGISAPVLRSANFVSARQAGMGMAYTAIANDEMLLYANPGGLGIKKRFLKKEDFDSIIYFLPLQFAWSPDFALTPLIKGSALGSDIKQFSLSANYPTDFAYIGSFWGISFISQVGLDYIPDSVFLNSSFKIHQTYQLNLGFNVYDFSVLGKKNLHFGIGAKLIYLSQFEKNKLPTDFKDKYKTILEDNTIVTEEEKGVELKNLTERVINVFTGTGIGLDFGFVWELFFPYNNFQHQLNFGLVIQDFPTYAFSTSKLFETIANSNAESICKNIIESEQIDPAKVSVCENIGSNFRNKSSLFRPNLKIGVAYILPDYLNNNFHSTTFSLDFHNITDSDYDFVEMYHVGASTSIFQLGDYAMNTSVGINQNQLNFGVIFSLNGYMISYNYFGERHLSSDASIFRHTLNFTFYL